MAKFENEENRFKLEFVVDHEPPNGAHMINQTIGLINTVMWLLAVRGKMQFHTTPESYRVVNGKKFALSFHPDHYTDVEGIVEGLKSEILDDVEWLRTLVDENRASVPMDERPPLEDLPGGLSARKVKDLLEQIYESTNLTGKPRETDVVGGALNKHVDHNDFPAEYVKRLWKAHKKVAEILGRDLAPYVRNGAARIGYKL